MGVGIEPCIEGFAISRRHGEHIERFMVRRRASTTADVGAAAVATPPQVAVAIGLVDRQLQHIAAGLVGRYTRGFFFPGPRTVKAVGTAARADLIAVDESTMLKVDQR